MADILVSEGVYHQQRACTVYEHIHSYPKLARGESRLDRLGMSAVRRTARGGD